MEENKNLSFIVTGASASGKTTLVQEAILQGFTCLPTAMTRSLKKGEIDGVHAKFMSEQEFKTRFANGDFLEDSLDYAKVHATGIYHGTPRAWIPELEKGKNVAMSVTPLLARKLGTK